MKTTIGESQIRVLIDLAKQATARSIIKMIEDRKLCHDDEISLIWTIRKKFGLEL